MNIQFQSMKSNGNRMKKAYQKDILRTVKKERKRFFSIMLIMALGVTMLTGIKAACENLLYSADEFYDEQNLYDIRILSTGGLVDDDILALSQMEGIKQVEGAFSETVYTKVNDVNKSVEMKSYVERGVNQPYVIEGNLPTNANEIAVSESYSKHANKTIGDTIALEDNEYTNNQYTISAIVIDPTEINNDTGAASFRSTTATDYAFFITWDTIESDIYTSIYLTLDDTTSLSTYSQSYEDTIKHKINEIESDIKPVQEDARHQQIIDEAKEQYEAMIPVELLPYMEEFDSSSIDQPQWFIQDRSSLSGYVNVQSDADSIIAIGTVFPIIFFVVAVLISLTTMTRLVEEERGLIGTYKALGFKDREILYKYLVYAFMACVLGGVLGDLCGFILMPKFLFTVFETMYLLPTYVLRFSWLEGIGGICLFIIGIVGATWYVCHHELTQTPAVLMCPKAPKAGSRVLLERLPFLWKRFSFLNKVTARNLFRYKRRLFMTIFGIMGCTALVLCGFAIKDSVAQLMPNQYEHINRYDAMFVADENEKMVMDLQDDEYIEQMMNLQVDQVKVINYEGDEEKVQLMVIPNDEKIEDYIHIEDLHGQAIQLQDSQIYVTQNASQVLNFNEGDTITIQNSKLEKEDIKVSNIVQNYLGNALYMTQESYELLFDVYEPNAVLVNFSTLCDDQIAFTEEIGARDGIISAVSTQQMREEFTSAFSLINSVVYLIIAFAAGLACIVLFTLSTTNISERERELATIKVLGFYDKEVRLYVNKETFILTMIGILAGLPAGYVLGHSLTYVLQMPSIHFAVYIQPISYIITAVITLTFALFVNIVTNRSLDKIDMVEALKSNE